MGPTTTADWNGAHSGPSTSELQLQELHTSLVTKNGRQITGDTILCPQSSSHTTNCECTPWVDIRHTFSESRFGQICPNICSLSAPGGIPVTRVSDKMVLCSIWGQRKYSLHLHLLVSEPDEGEAKLVFGGFQ